MMLFFELLFRYKWTIGIAIGIFIFSLLVANLGIWIAILIIILTILGALIGYIKDSNVSISEFIRNLK